MDHTTYMDVNTYENVYENYIEDKLDQDVVIPDYYCSARKIVNCQASVSDICKIFSEDKILIEGVCHWKILYLSEEDNALHHISCEKRFSEYFSVDAPKGTLRYKIKIKNVLCKLLSPQKAECKGTLCIAVQLNSNQSKKLLIAPDDEKVELKSEKKTVYEYLAETEKEFKVTGEIPYKFSDDYDIFKATSQAYISECSCSENKIIIKGHCKNTVILLHRDSLDAELLQSDVPFSQVIESDTVKENDIANIRCSINETETSYIGEGENSSILVCNHLLVEAAVFTPKEVSLLFDGYHPTKEVELQKANFDFCYSINNFDILARSTQKIHIDTRNASILFCECEGDIEKITALDTAMVVEGKLNVGILYNRNDEISYGTYPINLECRKTFDNTFENLRCDASVVIENLSYIILNETEIEISCDYRVPISVYLQNSFNVLSSLSVTEKAHDQCMDTPLIIYYASQGERIWEIGKKYAVPITVLKENNNLTEDIIENDQLIFITKH